MRRLLALCAKIAISAALLYLAFTRVDIGTVAARLRQAEFSWLFALVLVLALQTALVAVRWQKIAALCGAAIPIAAAFHYTMIGMFFNQTTPSTVGGDAARIWFAARSGAGWRDAAYSVIVDRFIGLAALIAIVVVCLPWLLDLVHDPLARASVLLLNGAGVAAIAAFLILGNARWSWPERWWITRHIAGTAAAALKTLRRADTSVVVIGISIAIHLLTVASIWCAARTVAAPLELWQALLLVPPVVLAATVPISIAGWGVREGAMMAAFSYAGLLDADGLIVSVLYGAGLFVIGVAGGLTWIFGVERPRAAPDRAQKP
jgi:uncharacterized membrane protein YbhN (UPF0104 family)